MMKTISRLLVGLLFLLLVAGIAAFIALKLYPKETVKYFMPKVSNIRIASTSLTNNVLNMDVKADLSSNLLPYLLDSMKYQAILYNDTISRGKKDFYFNKEQQKESKTLSLPMSIAYKSLGKKIKQHQGDSSRIGLAGQAYINIPVIGLRKFDFYKEVPFKMIVIPEIKIDKIDIDKLGVNDTRLKVKMNIINPNDIDFKINGMQYVMDVKDYLTTNGRTTDSYYIKANSTSKIEIAMKADMNKPLKAIVKAIKGDKFPYEIKMNMTIDPELKDFNTIPFSSVLTGEIKPGDIKKLKSM